ncbi:UNVERIFIED_CONTAM: putative mitochondrial protein [Sesamum radiatum]|uniref:Mitochondrial protein n=1 Tax=Sesamum radiatum TaxID=300843 RepID=A0AAW2V367_SESRA
MTDGDWVETEEGIRQCIVSHFEGVYASSRPRMEDIAKWTESLSRVVDASMAAIANRLKPLLDDIIYPIRYAFVPGRLITDNILLAFELNHFLNTKIGGQQGWMALKLDVSKAYDKVEWSFLEQFGSLVPERGLRQGDPLSPYLFLLCTESFSALLRSAEQDGRITGVFVCRAAPPISHLLFADDMLIFSRTSINSVRAVQGVLEVYRLALGQEINFSKSSMVFSRNTEENTCSQIVVALSIRRENQLSVTWVSLPMSPDLSKPFCHHSR